MRHRYIALTAVACMVAGVVLAGCSPFSSTTAPTIPAVFSNAKLCTSFHRSDRPILIVQRRLGGSPPLFYFGTRVSVINAGAAVGIASAMCELPALPAGLHCPATADVSYRLYFGHTVRSVSSTPGPSDFESYNSVTFNPTGCQILHGLGPPRWIARHKDFYRELGAAMSGWVGLTPAARQLLRVASESTFAGDRFIPAGYQPPS
jgi:hypothetical protein